MSDKRAVYLRRNVVVEPLVDQWYAWPYIVAPHTAAMMIAGRHLRLMESYINAPGVHAAAVRNPMMQGGPFLDYARPRVEEIKELLQTTRNRRSQLIALAAAIKSSSELLQIQASGQVLQPLYAQLPDQLRGYVELVYDGNHHPSMRFFEALLYRSHFYDDSAQSLMLSLITEDDRPFILSTPRLEDDESIHWHVPFSDPRLDILFAATRCALPLGEVRELLNLRPDEENRCRPFLADEPPPVYQRVTGEGLRCRYFGHACILIETKHVSILVDPILSYTYDRGISRFTYDDLPDHLDYVLITHNHQDHISLETILQLRHKIGTVVLPLSGGGTLLDPSLSLLLRAVGFRRIVSLDTLESIEFEGGRITALPFLGEHADLDIQTKATYHVIIDDHAMLFVADSCNFEPRLYQHAHDVVGDVSTLFLGMECDGAPLSWVYGPLVTRSLEREMDQSRRLAGSDCAQGLNLVDIFKCSQVYVYAMGQEPWVSYISRIKYSAQSRPIVEANRLVDECRGRGIVSERLYGEKEILLP